MTQDKFSRSCLLLWSRSCMMYSTCRETGTKKCPCLAAAHQLLFSFFFSFSFAPPGAIWSDNIHYQVSVLLFSPIPPSSAYSSGILSRIHRFWLHCDKGGLSRTRGEQIGGIISFIFSYSLKERFFFGTIRSLDQTALGSDYTLTVSLSWSS